MSHPVRRALVPITVVLVLGWIVSGCSGKSSEDSGATIGVQILSGLITLENRAGHPLLDMNVAIKAGPLVYTAMIRRMEAGDKRDLSLSDFVGRDAGRINLNLVRPQEVVVTASDLDGKKYEVTRPWKQ